MKWTDEQVKKFAAECIWETYGKTDCRYVVNKFFETYQDKPDESPESSELEELRKFKENVPQGIYSAWKKVHDLEEENKQLKTKLSESSVWPGEGEAEIEATRHCDDDGFQKQYAAFMACYNWLQSRTAVKAEGIEDLEKRLFNASKENAKLIAQITDLKSQPTAGGVNSPKDLLNENIVSETYTAQIIGKSSSELPENEPYLANLRAKSEDRANNSTSKTSNVENSEENRHQGGVKEEDRLHEERILINESNRVFYIDTFRKYLKMYDKEEISLSRFVELLNGDAAKFYSQPSPSNPSIKRPTEEEIDAKVRELSLKIKGTYHPDSWATKLVKAGINWLLSIQPDK